jgi:adenine-specific DNA-methyltransferase
VATEAISESAPSRRHALGAWNTPYDLAEILVRWALSDAAGAVLDPSFGGCSFLRAALVELRNRGCVDAVDHVYGVDIDESATLPWAAELHDQGVPIDNLIIRDFLTMRPADWPAAPFAAVVGNPPFVRHHWQTEVTRNRASAAASFARTRLSGRASTWAYFVVHAAEFVALGGRLAFVLPAAALHADYADETFRHLATKFGRVRLVRIHETIFPDADEEAVVLVAERRGGTTESVEIIPDCPVAALSDTLAGSPPRHVESDGGAGAAHWKLAGLSRRDRELVNRLLASPVIVPLGEVATIRIGVVTGANGFFVRRADDPLLARSAVRAVPIVSRGKWLRSPIWRTEDFDSLAPGARTRLLTLSTTSRRSRVVRAVLEEQHLIGVDQRSHCTRRDPWYVLPDTMSPDAFLPYMSAVAPHLIDNAADATCTNAVHRVWWRPDGLSDPRAALPSAWSTLFAVGCEVFGRGYGGGVLKLEPTSAAALPLVETPAGEILLSELDGLVRQRRGHAARIRADEAVLGKVLGLTAAEQERLRAIEAALRAQRRRR